MGARTEHGAELREEDVGPRKRETHRTEAERRVHLRRELEARGELVAADVERAQGDRPRRDRLDDGAIEVVLLVLGRERRAVDVEELRAVEADALGAMIEGEDGLGRELDVRLERDATPSLVTQGWSRALSRPRAKARCRAPRPRASSTVIRSGGR